MTLEEAIAHAADKGCGTDQCAADHRQLADWLRELVERRGQPMAPPRTGSGVFWRRVHNLVAHPLMEVLPPAWGDWLHDVTGYLAFIDQDAP